MRICQKMTWGFILVVVAVILTAVFSMLTLWNMDQKRLQIRSEVVPSVRQTMQLYEALVDMDHWIATYLLYGDPDSREEAVSAFGIVDAILRNQADDLGWPEADAAEPLIASIEQYIATITSMVQLKDNGEATRQIIEQQGRQYHDHMNSMLDEMVKHRQDMLRLIEGIQEYLAVQERQGWWVVILTTVSVVLLIVGIGVVSVRQLQREISRRQQIEEALENARVQADAANRAKTQFLANVSHEIRTPLNAIITLARLLNERDTKNLTEQQCEALAVMQGSSQQLLALINGILDVTKIESGRMEVTLTRTAIAPLLASVQRLGQTLIQDKPIDVRVDQASDLPQMIVTDAPKLQMILTNVMANAVKFTDQGEIVLRAACRSDEWVFEVTDTGIGIAPEDLDRIFEDFTQVDGSTTRRHGGAGLGLAITKGLTELLGGHIVAASTLGQGTTMTMCFPSRSDTTVADVEEKGPSSPAGNAIQSVRVLVAEDDKYGRAAVKMMLSDRCDLYLAVNGRDAVDQFCTQSPDIVFLDIMMPEMDGYQAFNEIRKQGGGRDVPVIALTAKAMADDREKLLAFGFTDYLSKPIDEDKLIHMISQHTTRDA